MITEGSVLYLPLLLFYIPLVSASARLCNFYVIYGGCTLSFVDKTTAFDCIHKHFLANAFFERKLEILDVGGDLFDRNAIIHTIVNSVRKATDTLCGDL